MRVQILELPTQYVGDNSTTPFAVVIDQMSETETQVTDDKFVADFKHHTGASTIWTTSETVEVVR